MTMYTTDIAAMTSQTLPTLPNGGGVIKILRTAK